MRRKAQDHDGHDQRVVGAEQAFEGDEQPDGDEIGAGDVQDALSILAEPASRLERTLRQP